jgi:hypothetical protein
MGEVLLYDAVSLVDTGVPWEPHRTLGIVLWQGPRGVRFLVSEVPLYIERTSERERECVSERKRFGLCVCRSVRERRNEKDKRQRACM